MKKFYLLLLMCCLGLQGYSYTSTTFYSSVPGDVTVLTNWSTTTLPSTLNPTPADFLEPTNTFIVYSNMNIGAGESWNVAGTVLMGTVSTSRILKNAGAESSITIGTALIMKSTSKITTALIPDGDLDIYLKGDLFVQGAATISPSSAAFHINIHFNNIGGQSLTWTSTGASFYTDLIVESGSTLTLNSNVPLPQGSTYPDKVNGGGTLICGTYQMSSANTDEFDILDYAYVYTANAGGLDSSLKQMSGINYSKMARYFYNGTVPQVTGVTLPDSLLTPAGTVTINNSTGVTLSKPEVFWGGVLFLKNGTLANGGNFYIGSGGVVYVDNGAFASRPTYQNNNVRVVYEDLGVTALAVTTGNELQPVSPASTLDTVGSVFVHKAGATITLGSAVLLDSVFLQMGTLNAAGSAINVIDGIFVNDDAPTAFVPAGNTVYFLGTSSFISTIGGASRTTFDNLALDRATAGLSLAQSIAVNNTLTLTNGRLTINGDTLMMGNGAAPVAGTLSSANMVVADAGGIMAKGINLDNTSYTFPIGDVAGNYTPVSYGTLMGGYTTNSFLGVNVVAAKPAANRNTNNYLKRYWNVYVGNITSPQYSLTGTYVPVDLVGLYTLMSGGIFTGVTPWIRYAPATSTTVSAATVNATPAIFTGIGTTAPTITSTPDLEVCMLPTTLNVLTSTGDDTLTYSWAPSTNLDVTTGTTVVMTPTGPGVTVYTVTVTDGNGFTARSTTAVTVNLSPSITGGITNSAPPPGGVCVDNSISFYTGPVSNVTTYSWSGPGTFSSGGATGTPVIDSAQMTDAGDYVLTVTNGPGLGCSISYTTTVVVNDTAAPVIATGGGVYCNSADVTATGGGAGNAIYYQDVVSLGISTTIVPFPVTEYASGTYFFRAVTPAGCWGRQDSVTVTINPLPNNYSVGFRGAVVPGSYCAGDTGVHIVLSDGSDTGVSYRVYHGGVAVGTAVAGLGTTDTLDLGLFTDGGNYAVIATNSTTGCTNLMNLTGADSVNINVVALPDRTVLFDHTPGTDGGYCANLPDGVSIDIPAVAGISGYTYQLLHNGVLVSPAAYVDGVSPEYFGNFSDTGIYQAIAVDLMYGCTDTLTDYDSIWINPLPAIYNVVGNDTECADGAGFQMMLSNGASGVTYGLYENLFGGGSGIAVGTFSPVGSGSFTFPVVLQTGPATAGDYYYTVIATDANGCIDTMADSGYIRVNPLPFDYGISIIDGSGQYCADSAIAYTNALGGSDLGIRYQLYNNGVSYGAPMDGTGGTISWPATTDTGTYTVLATDTITGCNITFATTTRIQQNVRPGIYAVSGGGTECADGAGFPITLSNSDDASLGTINYYLYENGSLTGTQTGTGATFDFPNQQVGPGLTFGDYTYVVVAVNSTTGCYNNMTGSGFIHVNPVPNIYNVTGGGAYCVNDTITYDRGLDGSETGISYQLYKDGTPVGTPMAGTSVSLDYGLTSVVGTYTIVALNGGTSCTVNMAGSAVVVANPVPQRYLLTGAGSYCLGTGGLPVGLSNSEVAPISYQLYNNWTPVGAPLTSSAVGAISFGAETLSGTYSVVATNGSTGCTDTMGSTVRMIIKPLPAVFTIAGGGSYCSGDTGRHIFLSGSVTSVKYTLYDGSAVGLLRGSGTGLDYGLFTSGGTYTIGAIDTVSGCSTSMAGSVTISINAHPLIWDVTGGGTACAGGGFHIGLDGANTNVRYQLYNDGVATGSPIAGTTGGTIDFGRETVAGTYTVIATDVITLCASPMYSSGIIAINPLPIVFPMTGGGTLCAGGVGYHIGLGGSESGIHYQMYTGGIPAFGPVVGTGSAIDFGVEVTAGTYMAIATNLATTCADTMHDTAVIIVHPAPTAYDLTGGGTYCVADTGVHVGLLNSDTGVIYQLNVDGGLSGSPLSGTGGPLDFGLQTAGGLYTITAVRTHTGCTNDMTGGETVTIAPYLTPTVTLTATQGTNITVGQADTLIAHVSGAGVPTFQWYINGNLIPGATNDTFFFNRFYFDLDSVVCEVTSHGACGGITSNQLIIITLYTNGVPQVATNNSDLKLAPNPNKGAFTVKGSLGTTADEEVELEITDMLGQAVYKTKVTATGGMLNEQIHLGNTLANGMYLLNVRTATQNNVFHFVMEQ